MGAKRCEIRGELLTFQARACFSGSLWTQYMENFRSVFFHHKNKLNFTFITDHNNKLYYFYVHLRTQLLFILFNLESYMQQRTIDALLQLGIFIKNSIMLDKHAKHI